ncbi:MAG: cytochrome c biogenesis protein CcsA [Ignavibacteriales bacterium]|jgi:ABC-type transport system involved in cytochrome c biogenesis permease subunit|nr:cytochrome c biogenesis protein CcsA [Ignavibacteriales bacterium]MBK8660467.1 cytochrome c biogenesis protein CcsA [Ignavibacteriales bacterium]MBP7542213.1 cytochrome c biogenesis protein CcsA [Ignavibacteriaceae bacterium]MBP9122337.1 cytochrome c biogenesis protein CcsA [Ignavibacteriaceae bacterium]MCC6638078.1 cytochrome c biogenesis protein CcsA [Ignavibacteriaceae bacterium]
MLETIHILNYLLPLLYVAVFAVYLTDFYKDKPALHNIKRIFLFVTLIIHTIYLVLWTIHFDHPPITTKFEIFSVLAFSIGFSYFLIELSTDIRATGTFILAISIIFQVISTLFIEDVIDVPEVLKNRLLGLHVISALCGYTGVTISAVYALLFTVQYKRIKLNQFGLVFNRLPSLELLEKLAVSSIMVGFALLTIAILIGTIWLPSAFPNFSYLDPKLLATGVVWLFYGAGLIVRFTTGLYGKKFMTYSIAGFIIAMISLGITGIIGSTFHQFSK